MINKSFYDFVKKLRNLIIKNQVISALPQRIGLNFKHIIQLK